MAFTPYNANLPTTQPNAPQAPNGFMPYSQTMATPQAAPVQSTQETPLLTGGDPSSNFSKNLLTAGKDIAVGAAKSAIGGVQSLGKSFLGAFGENKAGFIPQQANPVFNIQKMGVSDQTLASKSRGEQVGKVLETAGELGAGFTSTGAETALKTGYNSFKDARGAKLAQDELQNTVEAVRPHLTPTEEAAAKAAGRGQTQGGLLNRTTIVPSSRELEMGQFAHEAGVGSNNTFDKNIQLMKDAQKTSAEKLRSGLQGAQGTWTRNDVVGTLNNIKSPLTIKSDTTLTRLANNFKKAIVDLAGSTTKKPEGLLDLRQGVDKLIEKEFPANIYSKDTPVGQYVREVRQALNGMTESKLPEGKLPGGSTFKGELRRQSLLYDAIDNVASKAPKEGESARPIVQKAKDFAKKHPVVTTAAGSLTSYGVAKKLGVPLP